MGRLNARPAPKSFGLARSVSDQYEFCPGTVDEAKPQEHRRYVVVAAYCADCGFKVATRRRVKRDAGAGPFLAAHYRAKRSRDGAAD